MFKKVLGIFLLLIGFAAIINKEITTGVFIFIAGAIIFGFSLKDNKK